MAGLSGACVLIVEDDPDHRASLAELLAIAGYRVAVAENGREALEYLRSSPPPRVILLDLMMPVMNGWEFRARQRADPALAAIPVIAITAVHTEPTISPLDPETEVLLKPFEPKILLAKLAEHCGPRHTDSDRSP